MIKQFTGLGKFVGHNTGMVSHSDRVYATSIFAPDIDDCCTVGLMNIDGATTYVACPEGCSYM